MALGAILAPYIVGPPLAGGLRAAGLRHRGRLACNTAAGLRAAGLRCGRPATRRWPTLWSACNTAAGLRCGRPGLWSAWAVVGLQHRLACNTAGGWPAARRPTTA